VHLAFGGVLLRQFQGDIGLRIGDATALFQRSGP
jgi:hypothetical protein